MIYLTHLFIFIMASVGLSIILTTSSLFKSTREWIYKTYEESLAKKGVHSSFKNIAMWKTFWLLYKLQICNLCMGFWTGILVYPVWYRDLSVNIIIFGLVSSIASFTYAELIECVKRQ